MELIVRNNDMNIVNFRQLHSQLILEYQLVEEKLRFIYIFLDKHTINLGMDTIDYWDGLNKESIGKLIKMINSKSDEHKKELKTIKSEFKRRIEKAKNNKNKTIDKKGKLRSTKGLKLENWMAKLVVSDGKIYNSIGKFVDYEIPAGKKKENIDLLSTNRNKYAYVVELKGCNNKEYLKSIIEILHYYIAMKGYIVRESPLKCHSDVKGIELIKMAILIYKDGAIKRYLDNPKYEYITMLLDLFNIDCYEYSISSDNLIKDIEKVKVPSISK